MNTPLTELNIIQLDEIDSTNNYASALLKEGKALEGAVIWTNRQTHGRGYGKNVWDSEPYKNLTFSLVLTPGFLDASEQFLISQVVSLGLVDFLRSESDNVAIKWPNDLLVKDKKIAGMLIENSIAGTRVHSAVIGIGINLNQRVFPVYYPQATSLTCVTGKNYTTEESLRKVLDSILNWYGLLKSGEINAIHENYLNYFYRLGKVSSFRAGDMLFQAEIKGIDRFGQLLLEEENGTIRAWGFKSLEMIIS